jgi:hypothetical protein
MSSQFNRRTLTLLIKTQYFNHILRLSYQSNSILTVSTSEKLCCFQSVAGRINEISP